MLYNRKSKDIVQDVVLDDISDIIAEIWDEYDVLRRHEFLSIYCPSYIAREIVDEIYEYIDNVYMHPESQSHLLKNSDENVIITLSYDGLLFVEPAFHNNQIIGSDATMTYIYDSFKQSDVQKLSNNLNPVLVFGFGEDYDDEDECNGCCDCCSKNSHDYSSTTVTLNGKEVDDVEDKETIIKYINGRLDSYKEIYDVFDNRFSELNNLLKLAKSTRNFSHEMNLREHSRLQA